MRYLARDCRKGQPAPPWPLQRLGDAALARAVRAKWREVWTWPISQLWLEAGLVELAASWVLVHVTAIRGNTKLLGEDRLLAKQLGLGLLAQRALKVVIVDDAEPEPDTEKVISLQKRLKASDDDDRPGPGGY